MPFKVLTCNIALKNTDYETLTRKFQMDFNYIIFF